MRQRAVVATGLLFFSIQAVPGDAQQALPLKDGRPVVAAVNDETISLDELVAELGASADWARLRLGHATGPEIELLDRLVTVRLVAQEAARMGLDELPEIRKEVEVSSRVILRDVLMEQLVRDVKPDPADVEKEFRNLVREWKTASLLFQDEAAAARAHDEVAKGAKFADVSARAVTAKTAKADSDNEYHRQKDYLPPIAEAIAALQVGQVSPVVRIPAGFVVVTVTGIRYPENAEARAEARKLALNRQQQVVLDAHEATLRRQHVVVNKKVLDGIDYVAAKPGIDALLKDQRIVAEIKGAAPVTVGDLTDYLRMQQFHGSDKASQGERMNSRKQMALDATLGRRLMNMEALRLGVDKTHRYRDRVRAYEQGLVFDSFVRKAVAPGNEMKEEEVKRHYDGHVREYTYPEMRRVRSLAFTGRAAAEEAIRKAQGGADFGWLAANAAGQADKSTPGLQIADGQPITTGSMPEGMQKALAGSRAGDFRLYAPPEGPFYVLAVQEVIPSKARPYSEVRDEIAKKLYGEKLKAALDAYVGKLRAASQVATYLKKAR